MGIDEEATLASLKAWRRELIDPKIAERRGRVVKTTGDGALVVNDDVADVDPDAEFDPAVLGNGRVALDHDTLDFHGATYRARVERRLAAITRMSAWGLGCVETLCRKCRSVAVLVGWR